MSTISASTTSTTAYKVTADTTGTLVLQTGASPTTAVTIDSAQKVTFAYPPTATGGGSVSTNTAYGTSALVANTTGSNQAAFGYQAGYTQTTADRNTMMGAQAGYAATNGSANAYFGYQAGYGNTTGYLGVAVGAYALAASSTGYQNTAVGAYALTVATGNYNVSVGKDSGLALTTGSYNTFAGPGAGYAMTTGSSNTIIGAYGGNSGGLDIRTASNYIVLSDGSSNIRGVFDSSGNFLVGTTSALQSTSTFANGGASSRQVVVRNTGATGSNCWAIGMDNASYFYVQNQSGVGVYIAAGGTSWSALSDETTKDIIEPIENATGKVSVLRAVIGKYKTDEEGTRRSFLIAQDVQAVLPEAVNTQPDGKLGLQYSDVIPLLTAAIQELNAKVEAQAAEIATLKGQA